MTKQEVAAVACRILGVYAFLSGLGALQWVGLGLMSLASPSPPGTDTHLLALGSLLTSSLLPTILFVSAGAFLWAQADWIARRMTAGIVTGPQERVGSGDLLGTAIAVVGLVVLAQAVPHLCEALSRLWLQARGVQLGTGVVPDAAGQMAAQWVTVAVQIALGLWLLLGASGIANVLQERQRGRAVETTR